MERKSIAMYKEKVTAGMKLLYTGGKPLSAADYLT